MSRTQMISPGRGGKKLAQGETKWNPGKLLRIDMSPAGAAQIFRSPPWKFIDREGSWKSLSEPYWYYLGLSFDLDFKRRSRVSASASLFCFL
jgi:hypothetical protein